MPIRYSDIRIGDVLSSRSSGMDVDSQYVVLELHNPGQEQVTVVENLPGRNPLTVSISPFPRNLSQMSREIGGSTIPIRCTQLVGIFHTCELPPPKKQRRGNPIRKKG